MIKYFLILLHTQALVFLASAGTALANDKTRIAHDEATDVLNRAENSWAGPYMGLHFSTDSGTQLHIRPGETAPYSESHLDGAMQGGFIGYNFQNGPIVYGVEFSYSSGDTHYVPLFHLHHFEKFNDFKARLGYSFDNVLVYGVAGYSTSAWYAGHIGGPGEPWSGTIFGGGIQVKTDAGFFIGGEYLVRNGPIEFVFATIDTSVHSAQFRVGWQF